MSSSSSESNISILTLFFYTRNQKFLQQIHLIFLIDNEFPRTVLDSINLILRAQTIQNQYNFANKITLLDENFGDTELAVTSVRSRELAIEEKIENIMALDIAILEFIASVPKLVERNSFKLPGNFSVDYLVSELVSVNERQIISRLAKTFDIYEAADVCNMFEPLVLNTSFGGERTTKRYRHRDGDEDDLEHNKVQFTRFWSIFSNQGGGDDDEIPGEDMTIELRQLLFAMATLFSADSERVHAQLRDMFLRVDIDREHSVKATKRKLLGNIINDMSVEQSRVYAGRAMFLIVHFMTSEDNGEPIDERLRDQRNQILLLLSRFLDHLLEYIEFRVNAAVDSGVPSTKIPYSKLPIAEENFDPKDKPVTFLVHMIQYALNFAPFLSHTI